VRTFAFLYGIVFLALGIVGFIPSALTQYHFWLGFHINFWLNCLHVITGVFALLVALMNRYAARLFFQITGIVYALLGLLGFIYEDRDVLGLFASNSADTWLHVIAAIGALILGYGGTE
jgi:hypothetical protein